jgi:hypothetical protein
VELRRLRDTVALWYVDRRSAADVVRAACDVLAAGLGGPAMGELAAVSVVSAAVAEEQVPPLLAAALDEVGLDHQLKGSRAGEDAGVLAMAVEVLAGSLPPRALASWAFAHCGQDVPLLARGLAMLGARYAEVGPEGLAGLDAEVRAEARRLADQGSA